MNRPPKGSAEEVLDTACVIREIVPSGTPKEMLDRVINWEVQVNLDPDVSSHARNLMRKGYKAALTTVLIYLSDSRASKEATAEEIRRFLKDLEARV